MTSSGPVISCRTTVGNSRPMLSSATRAYPPASARSKSAHSSTSATTTLLAQTLASQHPPANGVNVPPYRQQPNECPIASVRGRPEQRIASVRGRPEQRIASLRGRPEQRIASLRGRPTRRQLNGIDVPPYR